MKSSEAESRLAELFRSGGYPVIMEKVAGHLDFTSLHSLARVFPVFETFLMNTPGSYSHRDEACMFKTSGANRLTWTVEGVFHDWISDDKGAYVCSIRKAEDLDDEDPDWEEENVPCVTVLDVNGATVSKVGPVRLKATSFKVKFIGLTETDLITQETDLGQIKLWNRSDLSLTAAYSVGGECLVLLRDIDPVSNEVRGIIPITEFGDTGGVIKFMNVSRLTKVCRFRSTEHNVIGIGKYIIKQSPVPSNYQTMRTRYNKIQCYSLSSSGTSVTWIWSGSFKHYEMMNIWTPTREGMCLEYMVIALKYRVEVISIEEGKHIKGGPLPNLGFVGEVLGAFRCHSNLDSVVLVTTRTVNQMEFTRIGDYYPFFCLKFDVDMRYGGFEPLDYPFHGQNRSLFSVKFTGRRKRNSGQWKPYLLQPFVEHLSGNKNAPWKRTFTRQDAQGYFINNHFFNVGINRVLEDSFEVSGDQPSPDEDPKDIFQRFLEFNDRRTVGMGFARYERIMDDLVEFCFVS